MGTAIKENRGQHVNSILSIDEDVLTEEHVQAENTQHSALCCMACFEKDNAALCQKLLKILEASEFLYYEKVLFDDQWIQHSDYR